MDDKHEATKFEQCWCGGRRGVAQSPRPERLGSMSQWAQDQSICLRGMAWQASDNKEPAPARAATPVAGLIATPRITRKPVGLVEAKLCAREGLEGGGQWRSQVRVWEDIRSGPIQVHRP